MIIHKFNTELQLLEVFYTGTIKIEELIAFGNQIYSNTKLPRVLHILTDASGATYEFSINEVSEIISNLKQNLTAFDHVKAAYIQSKPKETAFSTLVAIEKELTNYSHKVFATREAALAWLGKL